jgi:hypothetical protein
MQESSRACVSSHLREVVRFRCTSRQDHLLVRTVARRSRAVGAAVTFALAPMLAGLAAACGDATESAPGHPGCTEVTSIRCVVIETGQQGFIAGNAHSPSWKP